MKTEFIKSINGSLLVISDEKNTSMDYQMEMLKNNEIPGLLPCQVSTEDGVIKERFFVSGKQPLSVVFMKKQLDEMAVIQILKAIVRVIEGAREYMLCPDCIVFDPQYIFLNLADKEAFFVFDRNCETSAMDGIHSLSEYMIARVDHKDMEATRLAYSFYEVTNEESYSISDIKNIISLGNEGLSSRVIPKTPTAGEVLAEKRVAEEKKLAAEAEVEPVTESKKAKRKREKEINAANKPQKTWIDYLIWILCAIIVVWLIYDNLIRKFGRKGLYITIGVVAVGLVAGVFLWLRKRSKDSGFAGKKALKRRVKEVTSFEPNSDLENRIHVSDSASKGFVFENESGKSALSIKEDEYEKTGILVEEDIRIPRLIPADNCDIDSLILDHFPYVIGKSNEYADGCIRDSYISRIHCQIEKSRDGYMVTDLNSTNGTKVNGETLGPNQSRTVKAGDRIKIGKVEMMLEV